MPAGRSITSEYYFDFFVCVCKYSSVEKFQNKRFYSTNEYYYKMNRHDITEIFLKVTLNIIAPNVCQCSVPRRPPRCPRIIHYRHVIKIVIFCSFPFK
jgi:hypothetical protein